MLKATLNKRESGGSIGMLQDILVKAEKRVGDVVIVSVRLYKFQNYIKSEKGKRRSNSFLINNQQGLDTD